MGMSRDIYRAELLYGGKRFVAHSSEDTGAGDAMALCLSTLQTRIVEGKTKVVADVAADWAYETVDYSECEIEDVIEKFEELDGKVTTITLFECEVENEIPSEVDTSSPDAPALVKQDGMGDWHIFRPDGSHFMGYCFERDAAQKAESVFDYVRYEKYVAPTLENADVVITDSQYAEEFRCGRDPRD